MNKVPDLTPLAAESNSNVLISGKSASFERPRMTSTQITLTKVMGVGQRIKDIP
jgi:hypothetical protein